MYGVVTRAKQNKMKTNVVNCDGLWIYGGNLQTMCRDQYMKPKNLDLYPTQIFMDYGFMGFNICRPY